MATNDNGSNHVITAKDICEALRVPDAIKDLPKFSGNPKLLFEFLNNVDEIRSLISCTEGTPYGNLLLRSIRNKIEGSANEILNMYGTPLDWATIKQNLIHHYADKRNETSLIRDLHGIKQGNKPVEKFYNEIIEISATMTNYVQIHEQDNNVVKAKQSLYTEMCLNAFLSGLKEPLGATVRAMKPDNLATAFAYCIKEQNISYARYDNSVLRIPQYVRPTNRTHLAQNNALNPTFRQIAGNPNYRTPMISNPNNLPQATKFPQHNNIQVNQSLPQNPNYQFNRTNISQLPKAEPMEIGSANTRQTRSQNSRQNEYPRNNFFHPTGPANFVSKELFNVSSLENSNPNMSSNVQEPTHYHDEEADQLFVNENQDWDPSQDFNQSPEQNPCYEIDDQNFWQIASTSQSAT